MMNATYLNSSLCHCHYANLAMARLAIRYLQFPVSKYLSNGCRSFHPCSLPFPLSIDPPAEPSACSCAVRSGLGAVSTSASLGMPRI